MGQTSFSRKPYFDKNLQRMNKTSEETLYAYHLEKMNRIVHFISINLRTFLTLAQYHAMFILMFRTIQKFNHSFFSFSWF